MTDQAAKAAPPIRFRQFDDAWAERRLGDVSMIGDADHWMPETTSDGIPYVMTGDFCGVNEIDFRNAKRISQEDYEQLSKKIKPEYGDILFARYASIGSVRLIKTTKKFIASYSCAIIKGNRSYKSDYLFFLLQSGTIKKQIEKSINTGSQGNVGIESLKKLICNFPGDREQEKVGKLFQEIDRLFWLHQRKHEKLVALKKAMLQKMFPQPGATTPEVRFQGFHTNWEPRSLGEICEIVGGGTPSTAIPEYWNGTIDWYSPTEIGEKVYAEGSRRKITQLGLTKCSARILPPHKTVLFTSRAGIGDMAILAKEGCTNQGFQSLVLNDNIDPYCIYSLGHLIKAFALRTASGSTFLEISSGQLKKMKILLPENEEQKKIGAYFRSLDALIAQHTTQLQKLRQTKSAFLSMMFV